MAQHSNASGPSQHPIDNRWSWVDATARNAEVVASTDVGKMGTQGSTGDRYLLTNHDPVTWALVIVEVAGVSNLTGVTAAQHGAQTSGSLHAVASDTAAGFVPQGMGPTQAFNVDVDSGSKRTVLTWTPGITAGQSRAFTAWVSGWADSNPTVGGASSFGVLTVYNNGGTLALVPTTPLPDQNNLPSGWALTVEVSGGNVLVTVTPTANGHANAGVTPLHAAVTRSTS